MKSLGTLTAGLLLTQGLLNAADWTQWRGPGRMDHSPDTGLMKQWTGNEPERVWLYRDAGLGYSGFSIVDNRLFTMGASGNNEMIIALNASTGEELWKTVIGDLYENSWGSGPRGTPTVDGDRVYALSGRGNLVCVRADNGREIWKVSLLDHGGEIQNWGYTESVLIDEGKVICTPGGDEGTLAAFDKMTGKKVWQSDGITEDAQYSSPIVATHNGQRQYIQLVMKKVFGVAADTGELLWEADFPGRTAVIPTPLYHEGHVYVTAGYGVGCMLLKLAGNSRSVEVVYDNNKVMKNHHGGVVRIGDYVYGYSDGVGWTCQNFFTGEEVWANEDLGKGAIHYADGMLYCLEEDSGKVVLAEASTEGWRPRGSFTLSPQSDQRSARGKVWTHPVVINGRLHLRDQELVFAFDVKP